MQNVNSAEFKKPYPSQISVSKFFPVSGLTTLRITQNMLALIIWLSSLLSEKSTTLIIYNKS